MPQEKSLRVFHISLFLLSGVSFVHADSWTPGMLERATNWSVASNGSGQRTFSINGKEVGFNLFEAEESPKQCGPWLVAALVFPEQQLPLSAFRRNATPQQCNTSLSPAIILWNRAKSLGRKVELEDIGRLDQLAAMECGDFLGTGEELLVRVKVGACNSDSNERLLTERVYVYSLPDLNVLFAANSEGTYFSPWGESRFSRSVGAGTLFDGTPAMHITDKETFEVQSMTMESDERSRVALLFPESSRGENAAPEVQRCVVQSEAGEPLAGVTVRYERLLAAPPFTDQSVEKGTLSSSDEGSIELPVGVLIDLEIDEEGFYPLRERFYTQEVSHLYGRNHTATQVTEEVVQLTLERRIAPVKMWESRSPVTLRLNLNEAESVLGLRLEESPSTLIKGPGEAVQEADIIFTVLTDDSKGKGSPCPWKVTVGGQNGWAFVAAAPDEDAYSVTRAPAEGYVERLSFTNCALPEMLFVRKDGGERYGLIYNLGIDQTSNGIGSPRESHWRIYLKYRVQASANSSRSVVPK